MGVGERGRERGKIRQRLNRVRVILVGKINSGEMQKKLLTTSCLGRVPESPLVHHRTFFYNLNHFCASIALLAGSLVAVAEFQLPREAQSS